ncbi:LPS assembly lipoprotein LptE [Flavobacterium sp. J372]|uniref:LPS assembly lipoprotein LptE n=1 Tax=Flavobacterium sp. J372 TaxID=2898436 RepID=UPI002150E140|nr:LptE family protein [Flavobacterium sp. J372]MCR5861567.1 LPS assembly lipoprotein LptE [Flavobacterium sp. J372]
MKRFLKYLSAIALLFTLSGCGIYSFTGTNVSPDIKTFQVNYFQNNADIVEPGIDLTFTRRLQDLIQNQTNLSLTNSGGDLVYEGEIVEYRVSPMTATANQRAAQNRLTIAVMVRFTNKKKEDDNFEKRFSFFYDYDGNDLPRGAVLSTALEEIFERITQDIFNDTLAKW